MEVWAELGSNNDKRACGVKAQWEGEVEFSGLQGIRDIPWEFLGKAG